MADIEVEISEKENIDVNVGTSQPIDISIIGTASVYSETDPLSIHKDGSSTTSAKIPFVKGATIGNVESTISINPVLSIANTDELNPYFVVRETENNLEIINGCDIINEPYSAIVGAVSNHPLNLRSNNHNFVTINTDGTIVFSGYGAGYLQTDADGNITAGSVPVASLQAVTDVGNSTDNSVIIREITLGGLNAYSIEGETGVDLGIDGTVYYELASNQNVFYRPVHIGSYNEMNNLIFGGITTNYISYLTFAGSSNNGGFIYNPATNQLQVNGALKLNSHTIDGFVKTSGSNGTLAIDTNSYLTSETDPVSLHLDQTTPQTFTGGAVTGNGILKVTSGTLGLDTNSYLTSVPSHNTTHGVTGSDSVFPADPNADRFLMWDDSEGALVWSSGGGTGATQQLDNLSSVAINTTLISDTDNTDDLGSSAKEWKDLYIDGIGYIDEIQMLDSEKIRFGTGQDLEVYFDGTTAYIDNLGTQNSDILVRINDGGTTRTAIQIHGSEGAVSFPRQSQAQGSLSGDQTISHSTYTTVVFNSEYDVLGEFNTSTGGFTPLTNGNYFITSTITWKNTDANKLYVVRIYKNTEQGVATFYQSAAAGTYTPMAVSGLVSLTTSDTLYIKVYQNSGGNESIMGSEGCCIFTILKVA